ncbi:MAG: DUF1302 domain-containing protein, partial [Gammaproteobacteria bacterium]|nr:DUF1302 domain-containing protein [Gammaproteobacteria bacterium]
SLEINGFADNTTHQRFGSRAGLSKMRNRGQLEFSKYFKPTGIFSELSIHSTVRASYDAVYDINDDDWGKGSGSAVNFQSLGGPAIGLPSSVPWGATANPALGPAVLPGTNPFAISPTSPELNGFFLGPNGGTNPNSGLRILGSESFTASTATAGNPPGFGGLQLAYPTQPCDIDSRGCINGYMDKDEDDLRFAEFNDRQDWLRELYIDATIPLASGDELNFRVGRQQVVWGRTDLFRVLDQINPIDFSIQNIYEEFEDSRIPMGMFNTELRLGATGAFDDLNFQVVWKFEQFRPHNLGQGGQPYSILDAGNLFRALNTCWDSGCTVANFAPNQNFGLGAPPPLGPGFGLPGFPPAALGGGNATGLLATTFPAHTIGIRQAFLPDWEVDNGEIGFRMEGLFKDVGFSVNALYSRQQLPSLHGGTEGPPAINPFLCDPTSTGPVPAVPGLPPGALPPVTGPLCAGANPTAEAFGTLTPRTHLIAFDIHFPRVFLLGASADFYIDPIKSAFRVEVAHTTGEEFANTLRPSLYSESNVLRWVVGWDRSTFIKFLHPTRAFLISAQLFGQHLLNHEKVSTPFGPAGMPDWENNVLATFLIQGGYLNDRVQPRILVAYDTQAKAGVFGPAVDWLINDNWRLVVGANFKFGRAKNDFDDVRLGNQFPPFTDPAEGTPGAGTLPAGQTALRIGGIAPLGAFRGGPIGMAQDEDEIQIMLRYRF